MVQVDWDELRFGTLILIWLSLQDVMVAETPAIVTLDAVVAAFRLWTGATRPEAVMSVTNSG
jgi:hypothetical protein